MITTYFLSILNTKLRNSRTEGVSGTETAAVVVMEQLAKLNPTIVYPKLFCNIDIFNTLVFETHLKNLHLICVLHARMPLSVELMTIVRNTLRVVRTVTVGGCHSMPCYRSLASPRLRWTLSSRACVRPWGTTSRHRVPRHHYRFGKVGINLLQILRASSLPSTAEKCANTWRIPR